MRSGSFLLLYIFIILIGNVYASHIVDPGIYTATEAEQSLVCIYKNILTQ